MLSARNQKTVFLQSLLTYYGINTIHDTGYNSKYIGYYRTIINHKCIYIEVFKLIIQ